MRYASAYLLTTRMAATRLTAQRRSQLHVEAKLHHVAVCHHVILAFNPHLARGLGGGHRSRLHQVGKRHDLGLDETLLEIAVDDARSLRRCITLVNRPGPRLFWPCG